MFIVAAIEISMRKPALKVLALGLALWSVLAFAESPERDKGWPFRWGGAASSNMANTATNLPADLENVAPLWELPLGQHQYAIPTIDRGRIYLCADDSGVKRAGYKPTRGGVVMCVEQATGKLIWQMLCPRYLEGVKPPYHFDQWGCGICSGPVVEGDRVYVIGSRGEILCLDREGQANGNQGPVVDELEYMEVAKMPGNELCATDGDIIWRYNLIRELDVVLHDVCGSTLLVQDDLIYACTSNGIDDRHDKVPRPEAPTLVVLNKKTGRLVARDNEKIGQRMFHCNWSSPAGGWVDGKPLVFFGGGDGILYAFEPPRAEAEQVQVLRKAWSFDCNPPEYRSRGGQAVPYSTHSKNSPEGPSEIIGTPVFYEGRVYVAVGQSPLHGTGQGQLCCVEAATGRKIWCSGLVDRTLATAAIAKGLLYIPDYTGNLHCFDALTGERCWTHALGAKGWSASSLVADGKVYASTEANTLWVLKAGKAKEVLSKTRLKSTAATLTAADGVLYIPTQKSLLAIEAKSGRS